MPILNAVRTCLRRAILLLVVLSLLAPTGTVFAYADSETRFFMCGVNGAQALSWREITGERLPSEQPSSDREHCDACIAACRALAAPDLADVYLPGVDLHAHDVEDYQSSPPDDLHIAGPPLPSRAPPVKTA